MLVRCSYNDVLLEHTTEKNIQCRSRHHRKVTKHNREVSGNKDGFLKKEQQGQEKPFPFNAIPMTGLPVPPDLSVP